MKQSKRKKAIPPGLQTARRKMGANIRRIRRQKGMTLKQVADRSGINSSRIARMEKGEINISVLTIFHLSIALKVHPREIIDF